jgi:hypothetical protein
VPASSSPGPGTALPDYQEQERCHVVWVSQRSFQPGSGSPLELVATLCLTFGVIGVLLLQQRGVGKLGGGLALLGQVLLVGQTLNAALFLSWPIFWWSLVAPHSALQQVSMGLYYGAYLLLPATLFIWGLISFGVVVSRPISVLLLLLGLNSTLRSFVFSNTMNSDWLALTRSFDFFNTLRSFF